jgi:hypothetical protein
MMEPEALSLDRYAEVLAHTVYFGPAAKAEVLARLGVDATVWIASGKRWLDGLMAEAAEDEHPVTNGFAAAYTPVQKRLKADQPTLESLGPLPEPIAPLDVVAVAALPAASAPVAETETPVPVVAEVPTFVLVAALPAVPPAVPAFSGRSTVLAFDPPRPAAPEEAMPFLTSGRSDPERVLANAVAHAESVQGPRAVSPKPVGSATAFAPNAPPAASSLPFHPAPGAPAAALTLEQYASLCIDLEVYAARADEVLARYRLTGAQKAALDAHFQELLARKPMEWLAFERARASYKVWLSQANSRS